MFVAVVSLVILCYLYYTRKKIKSPAIPEFPGAWPIVQHAYMLMSGDSKKVLEVIKRVSLETLKQGGYLTFSLGPIKYYILTDPDDCALVMDTCFEKHYLYSFAKPWLGEGLLTTGANTWNKHRKLMYPMFNQQLINGYLSVFNQQSRELVRRFAVHVGKGPFDFEPAVMQQGLETIYQTALGTDVADHLTRNADYINAIDDLLEVFTKRLQTPWLHTDGVYNWSALKREQDGCLEIINSLANEFIQKRKCEFATGNQVNQYSLEAFKPFIQWILKVADENHFSANQIREDVNTLIATGYDTSSRMLIYILMNLGHHQEIQEKVYREILQVFGNSDYDVEKRDLLKLVYLEAVIKETLRLFQLAPMLGRYVHVNLKLKRYTIPAGSNCFVSVYGLHRHHAWGADAEVFRPERWLEPGVPAHPSLFAGFGLGRRYCIGKTYAMMSMKTSVVHILRNYKITADITKLEFQMGAIMRAAGGQNIALDART